MRVAFFALAMALFFLPSLASAQTNNPVNRNPGINLPTYASTRFNMTGALGNIFTLRNVLPSFRSSGPVSSNIPGAVPYGVPDPSNSSAYLQGFGFRRPGR